MSTFPNAISEFVYVRTYSRWVDSENRRETWEETVHRYVSFIRKSTKDKGIPEKVFKKILEKLMAFEVMPSMRLLWSAGNAVEKQNMVAYNCSFLTITKIDDFAELLYILMCGTGVGFSVERNHTNNLPPVPDHLRPAVLTHAVLDSKEGWADSLKILLNNLYSGSDVAFNYNMIRPQGSKLRTMGGRASGPSPLIRLHEFVRNTFRQAQGRRLKPVECHDICCMIAEVVVVGGVRRSSLISLSDLDDMEMRNAKTGNFPVCRYMSNNSAVFHKKPTAVEFLQEWGSLAASGTGERGIFNLEGMRVTSPDRREKGKIVGTNPCVTADTLIVTPRGKLPVSKLVGKRFDTEVYGYEHTSTSRGFWSRGVEKVYKVVLDNGAWIKASAEHRLRTKHSVPMEGSDWIRVKNLKVGDKLLDPADLPIKTNTVESVEFCGEEEVFDCSIIGEFLYNSNGMISHNCGEIALRDHGLCNLTSVVVRATDDLDSLLEKVETATWMGCIQATLTKFPYLSPIWGKNANEERLLGVSLSGQMDAPHLLTPDALKAMRARATKVAKHASTKLGINMPAAITCVKPEGTAGLVVNSSSGVHPRFAQYYIRRVRISSVDPLCRMMRSQGMAMSPENGMRELDWDKADKAYVSTAILQDDPEALRVVRESCPIYDPTSSWSADKVTTWVVSFPVASPKGAILVKDMDAITQLEWYKKIQENWCEHTVSMTCYVKDDEWFKVGNWVYENWDSVKGISFLPATNASYEQMPYEEIDKKTYDKMLEELVPIDYTALPYYESEDNTIGAQTLNCTGNVCEVV